MPIYWALRWIWEECRVFACRRQQHLKLLIILAAFAGSNARVVYHLNALQQKAQPIPGFTITTPTISNIVVAIDARVIDNKHHRDFTVWVAYEENPGTPREKIGILRETDTNTGKIIVDVDQQGHVTLGSGETLDDASILFWQSIQKTLCSERPQAIVCSVSSNRAALR